MFGFCMHRNRRCDCLSAGVWKKEKRVDRSTRKKIETLCSQLVVFQKKNMYNRRRYVYRCLSMERFVAFTTSAMTLAS